MAMRTHVALLRGINVVGRNKVSMAELRQVVASLGHGDVATYIQSGNVLFTAAKRDANNTALADDLEIAIADRLAVRPVVVVLARREVTDVVRDNPFRDEEDHRLLHAVFLREAPGPNGVASVEAAVERARSKESRDDVRVVGRTLYLWTPDGFARNILRAELSRGGQHRTPMPRTLIPNAGKGRPPRSADQTGYGRGSLSRKVAPVTDARHRKPRGGGGLVLARSQRGSRFRCESNRVEDASSRPHTEASFRSCQGRRGNGHRSP